MNEIAQANPLSFAADAYYAQEPLRPKEKNKEGKAEAMLRALLGSDAEAEVRRSVKQWNLTIREYIRSVTALRLAEGEERQAVPVEVVAGLPQPFSGLLDRFNDERLWWITINRPMLENTLTGLSALTGITIRGEEVFDQLRDLLVVPEMGIEPDDIVTRSDMCGVENFIESLLEHEKAKEIMDALKTIEIDILGAYFFNKPVVQIYWMVTGAIARMLAVPIADLTIVVLCHELAHAYTHLGRDIDQRAWDTNAFSATDKLIVEGLAQFYTEIACRLVQPRLPGANRAFQKLLQLQPIAYTDFKDWFLPDQAKTAEAVRSAMIEFRTDAPRPYNDFREMLTSAHTRINGSRTR